jgi:hypothetical protein
MGFDRKGGAILTHATHAFAKKVGKSGLNLKPTNFNQTAIKRSIFNLSWHENFFSKPAKPLYDQKSQTGAPKSSARNLSVRSARTGSLYAVGRGKLDVP